ncbi:MAG: M56 family metallopeptidase [Pseudomonadota bacterium]|nr:M56 family metallopeptidase [Gammaproteobacteria bacterium]MDQ3582506.1 M56 family metallopeptidase [Pseudomonadota bacterium]
MNETLAILPLALVAFALLALSLGAFAGTVYRRVRPMILRYVPHQRAHILLWIGSWPMAVALVCTLLTFLPALGAGFVDHHCHPLEGCMAHVPALAASDPGRLAGLIVLCVSIIGLSAVLVWCARLRRVGARLAASAKAVAGAGYRVIDETSPIACSLGWLRPQVVFSRGLLGMTDTRERAVILAHELAHGRRFDNLRQLLMLGATWAYGSRVRRLLVADLRAASEQACDAEAARTVRDPRLVAATLIRLARATRCRHSLAVCGIDGADIEARVHALLVPARTAFPTLPWAVSGLAASSIFPAASIAPLHHVLEWLARFV